MTKKELDEEIEYIHENRYEIRLLRPLDVMENVINESTNTYTNLSSFMNDYLRLFYSKKIEERVFNSAMNDLYLLALLHASCEEV